MKIVLAIETSCDETACAIARGRAMRQGDEPPACEIIGEAVASQIEDHVPYGGVVPEIASRKHVEALVPVTTQALAVAGIGVGEVDAVAVTHGPGLIGALLTGLSFAKGLALSLGVPLVGVHHIEAHICANYLSDEALRPPFAALVVSGGHSHLIEVTDWGRHALLARTRDDAAGEAFDKAARALGLPYPGGPHLDALAEGGREDALSFRKSDAGGEYSFSGLKTGLRQALERAQREGRPVAPADAAASFRRAVVDQLLSIALPATRKRGLSTLALAGGVASNRLLRREAQRQGEKMGLRVVAPPARYCTDNAAMVAVAAYHRLVAGRVDDLSLGADPSLPLP